MTLTAETARTRWIVMAGVWVFVTALLFVHTTGVRDYLALIDAQGLRGAPAASTPLKRIVPLLYCDAQMWVLNTLDLQENGGARVRFTAADNAPFGREVHWSSTLVWIISGAGHLRHIITGEPLPLATEGALPWINFALLLALLIAFSAWTASRAGAGAGALVAFGMLGHRDFYDGFSPHYVDHHGLITAAVFGTVLGALFMGGGWWRTRAATESAGLLPKSRNEARHAAIVSALCGAVGLWISAASVIPAIGLTGACGLVATWWWGHRTLGSGAEFDAGLWRIWGRVGALTSALFYLVEYAPAHFGLRMEVNHPLYALAWWGGAELVALLAERSINTNGAPPVSPRSWLLPALAVAAAPVVILLGGVAVFVVRDPFVGRLSSHVLEGMSLFTVVRATGWGIFFLHVNETLLPVIPAVALLTFRETRDRVTLGFILLATLGFVALACGEIRFWQNTSGPQLTLTLVVLAALSRDWGTPARWLLVTATALVLFVPPTVSRIVEVRSKLTARTASRIDLAPAVHRDIAAALRSSQPSGHIVLLACPTTATGVGYYGRFKTVGTLYWENYAGLRAAAEIFSAPRADEARSRLRARGVTHLVLTSEEDFLREFFSLLHPEAPPAEFEKTFGYQLFVKQQIPVWLRLLPYAPPTELRAPGMKIFLLQVVPDQTNAEALYHIAAAQLANGDPTRAERTLRAAFDATPTDGRETFALNAGNLCYRNGARTAAAALYRAGLTPGSSATLATNLAWLLATDPDASIRNGREALALAERAAALHPEDAGTANALAAALAECGRFSDAVVAGVRAVTLSRAGGNAADLAAAERRLAAYRSGDAWRQ